MPYNTLYPLLIKLGHKVTPKENLSINPSDKFTPFYSLTPRINNKKNTPLDLKDIKNLYCLTKNTF